MGAILPAVEDRLKVLVLIGPGFWLQKRFPAADQINFAPHVKVPVLMLNGLFYFIFPTAVSQEPMFRLLGTSSEKKRRVVYDAGHDIPHTGNDQRNARMAGPIFRTREVALSKKQRIPQE